MQWFKRQESMLSSWKLKCQTQVPEYRKDACLRFLPNPLKFRTKSFLRNGKMCRVTLYRVMLVEAHSSCFNCPAWTGKWAASMYCCQFHKIIMTGENVHDLHSVWRSASGIAFLLLQCKFCNAEISLMSADQNVLYVPWHSPRRSPL